KEHAAPARWAPCPDAARCAVRLDVYMLQSATIGFGTSASSRCREIILPAVVAGGPDVRSHDFETPGAESPAIGLAALRLRATPSRSARRLPAARDGAFRGTRAHYARLFPAGV